MVCDQQAALRRNSLHLLDDPGVQRLELRDVLLGIGVVGRRARGIRRVQTVADVLNVLDRQHRVQPEVRIVLAMGMVCLVSVIIGGLIHGLSRVRLAARQPGGCLDHHALAAGILTAWAVMFVRVMITVAIVNRELLPTLVRGFGVMALTAAVMALATNCGTRASRPRAGNSLP